MTPPHPRPREVDIPDDIIPEWFLSTDLFAQILDADAVHLAGQTFHPTECLDRACLLLVRRALTDPGWTRMVDSRGFTAT